ncbi:MAG: CpXC domain-containing protein [Treponema sp.]|nr:CpXC domain-containing protein [Treponema sp.]
MKKNITCLCGTNISFEYEEEIDLDLKPEILKSIFNGTFMSSNCGYCGKKHKPEYKILISWKSKNLNMEVLPELDRGEFFRNKKDNPAFETIIGFPEMADRLAVINDSLEPVIIETLKYYLLEKAAENYPDNDVNVWYHCKGSNGIEFHLDGIRQGEVAVMRIPHEIYDKTSEDYKKHPKNGVFPALRVRSYLSVQNLLRPDALK